MRPERSRNQCLNSVVCIGPTSRKCLLFQKELLSRSTQSVQRLRSHLRLWTFCFFEMDENREMLPVLLVTVDNSTICLVYFGDGCHSPLERRPASIVLSLWKKWGLHASLALPVPGARSLVPWMGVVYRSSLLLPFVDRAAVAAPPPISCLFLYIVLLLCTDGLAGGETKEFPIASSSWLTARHRPF